MYLYLYSENSRHFNHCSINSEGEGEEDSDNSKHHKEISLVFDELPANKKSKKQNDDLVLVVHTSPVVLQALHQVHYLVHVPLECAHLRV